MNVSFSFLQFRARLRPHVHFHPAFERNRVDRRAAAHHADVEGRLWRSRDLDSAELLDGAAHRERGTDEAEGAVAVAAGAFERRAIPLAADGAVGDVVAAARAVHRDEGLDAVFVGPFQEEVLHAAQVAESFFADVADEEDVALRRDAGCVHRANDRQQHRERSRVVADARRGEPGAVTLDLDVRAFRKHRVEMCGDGDERAAAGASAQAHDVAFGITFDVRQASGAQHLEVRRAACVFLERRRRNLRELDDFGDETVVILVDGRHRGLELRIVDDALHSSVGRGSLRPGGQRAEAQHEGDRSSDTSSSGHLLPLTS